MQKLSIPLFLPQKQLSRGCYDVATRKTASVEFKLKVVILALTTASISQDYWGGT